MARALRRFPRALLIGHLGLMASPSYGLDLDLSPFKPRALLTESRLHPDCARNLSFEDRSPVHLKNGEPFLEEKDLNQNADRTPESSVERSDFSCLGLKVFNSYEILSSGLEVRLSRFPSASDTLLSSFPGQDGWILDQDQIIPVAQVRKMNRISYVHLPTGQLVFEQLLSFDKSQVYLTNLKDRELSFVELPQSSTGFLETNLYRVVSKSSARLPYSPEMNFSPEHEPDFFDQVQVYYQLGRVTRWFLDRGLGLKDQVEVRIHLRDDEEINNGAYVPDGGLGPLIKIGQGDSFVMAHLARDLDVIAHEYAHHVIFQTLKTSRGESGILHEGYADYFAFAQGEDPHLAETIMVSGLPLRTADLPQEYKFNREGKEWSKHRKSQFFSRLLWLLRENYGETFDSTVLQSLKFLKPEASLHDGLHALLLATPSEDQRCHTFDTALSLGFDEALVGLDGSPCGLNLGDLPQEAKPSPQRSLIDRKAFGCSAVTGTFPGLGTSQAITAGLLLLPLVLVFRFKIGLGQIGAFPMSTLMRFLFRILFEFTGKRRPYTHPASRWLHRGRQYDHET